MKKRTPKQTFLLSLSLCLLPAAGSCKRPLPNLDNPFNELRGRFLNLKASDIGFKPSKDRQILGASLEFFIQDNIVSLVAVSDGSASLYFSTGGGIIGIGQHKEAVEPIKAFLNQAQMHLPDAKLVTETPLPAKGQTLLYLITTEGIKQVIAPDMMTLPERSPFFPLFDAGQHVISVARMTEEKRH